MKIIYIANDGTQFDNEWDCMDHEFKLSLKDLDKITIRVDIGNDCYRYYHGKDMFNDDVYNYSDEVKIETPDALESFLKISEYCGWGEFLKITEIGHYKYLNKRFFKDENCWEKLDDED